MQNLRIAVLQPDAACDMPARKLEHLESAIEQAARTETQLLLCPELYQCGYNAGEAIRDRAEPIDGPFFRAVQELAQRWSIAVAYGYPEAAGDRLYNAVALVDAEGSLLANHRKLALPSAYEKLYFDSHHGLTLCDFAGWRVALLICYDVEFPETARAAALAGAELILAPTALAEEWSVVAEKVIPARAFENGIYLAYANFAGVEKGLRYFGGSRIVGPDGLELATADHSPTLIFADLERGAVERARKRLAYLTDQASLQL